MNRNDGADSKTKCISFERKGCTGNIYTQLSLEERTMVHTRLERAINPMAIAVEVNRSLSTLSCKLRPNG